MESERVTGAPPPRAAPRNNRMAKDSGFKLALERHRPPAPPPAPRAPATAAMATAAPAAPRSRDPFRDRIAMAEGSREDYSLRNPASGALGRYQFVPQALQDLGWQDANGQWTALAAAHGVTSEAQVLANPAAQEAAMTRYLARTEQQLAHNGALAQAGGSVPGMDGQAVPLTEAGLIAAAHRRGAGSVARYLAHRANTPDASLTPQQRNAFASVERRLRDFSELPYALASRRGGPTPSA